jgi:uncharacterized membrane protein YeaQ/YmgE (transglycosylase-associated protein family)
MPLYKLLIGLLAGMLADFMVRGTENKAYILIIEAAECRSTVYNIT